MLIFATPSSKVIVASEKGLRRTYWTTVSSSVLFSGETGSPWWTLQAFRQTVVVPLGLSSQATRARRNQGFARPVPSRRAL